MDKDTGYNFKNNLLYNAIFGLGVGLGITAFNVVVDFTTHMRKKLCPGIEEQQPKE